MNKRPKILMLGWEFPPIINGGLGVACHDLSSAMSDMSDITMIVPKTSRDFRVKGMKLIGINNLSEEMFGTPSNYHQPLPFTLHAVPAELDPYHTARSQSDFRGMSASATGEREQWNSFTIESLYGGDVIGKVIRFADISSKLAESIEFDVIHAHDWMTMIAGMRIREWSGKPLVMHIHSLEVDRGGPDSRGWVYDLEKRGMEAADLVIPVSNFTAQNIEEHYGIPRSKMWVVHNGSRPVRSFRSRRRFREKTVLFVGRLTRQKGPEKFLDIAGRVLEKKPDVRFVMAGAGDYFRSVIEQSSYQRIGNRFHLTGFLNSEKLNYLFSISDVYCMPSVSEPFGLSAVEAAHFGIPCVISKQSGVAEVLSGALKFDYWDVNKAADCILSLLEDKVLRKRVVEDAARNLDSITWKHSASRVLQAYADRKFI